MTRATASTPTRNTAVTANSRFRNSRWSTILSIPVSPESRALITWKFLGSFRLTRKEAGMASGETLATRSFWSLKICWNRRKASAFDS